MISFDATRSSSDESFDRVAITRWSQDSALMAYQVAFDLSENQNQPFLLRIVQALPPPVAAAASEEVSPVCSTHFFLLISIQVALQSSMEVDSRSPISEAFQSRYKKLADILSGETASDLYLQFLYMNSKTDLQIITSIKVWLKYFLFFLKKGDFFFLQDKLEARNSVTNSCAVIAHAMMQCGTTSGSELALSLTFIIYLTDVFLRENLTWLGRATHWAKFTATASIGVIHKVIFVLTLSFASEVLSGAPQRVDEAFGLIFARNRFSRKSLFWGWSTLCVCFYNYNNAVRSDFFFLFAVFFLQFRIDPCESRRGARWLLAGFA